MTVLDEPVKNDHLEIAKNYLSKCESELASLATSQQYHRYTITMMQKDLASEITAWKAVIASLTPKEGV